MPWKEERSLKIFLEFKRSFRFELCTNIVLNVNFKLTVQPKYRMLRF